MARERIADDVMVQKLYTVQFVFNDDYAIRRPGWRSIELVIPADDQFTALSIAWEQVAVLGCPEPKSFTARKAEKE